jgi:gliding motility-associated lipoprotein GldD
MVETKTLVKMKINIGLSLFTAVFVWACGSSNFVPKPRGYNHIELPAHAYQLLDVDTMKYSFEYSKSAVVTPHLQNKSMQVIDYKGMGAKVWLTYYPIHNSVDTLDQLIYTTYKLLQKNNVRAEAIANDTIKTASGKTATIFYLEGEVPTQYQFYYHDSTTNFLRGALYFETAQKNDSLAPVINFVKEDINHMINTLKWKK